MTWLIYLSNNTFIPLWLLLHRGAVSFTGQCRFQLVEGQGQIITLSEELPPLCDVSLQ